MLGEFAHSWAADPLVAEGQLVERLLEEGDDIRLAVVICPLLVGLFWQTLSNLAIYLEKRANIRWCGIFHN